jgi:hypothetical protein
MQKALTTHMKLNLETSPMGGWHPSIHGTLFFETLILQQRFDSTKLV